MNALTHTFLAFVALGALCELWLDLRHLRHVRAHREAVPEAFAARVPLADHQKAADYTVTKTRFGILSGLIGTALLLAWTVGGGLDAVDRWWLARGHGPVITGTATILSVMTLSSILTLPLSIYRTFVIEARFGFNKTTPRLFVLDLLKSTIVLSLIATPLTMAVLWLMGQMGALWWLYVWGVWMAFSLLMIWAYPAVIAPIFNKFRPLDNEALLSRVNDLLSCTGFTSRGVFVMDGSRRSAHGNAYFTGIGRNKRVVFFDTLLNSLDIDEVEAVLAHELGHFKLKHINKSMAVSFATTLAALAFLGWLLPQQWFYSGLGVSVPSTHTALLLFMLAGPVFTFFLSPLWSWRSRVHEFEADAFAVARVAKGFLISALVKLYQENANTLTPDPLHSLFHDSHPPAPTRIARLQSS